MTMRFANPLFNRTFAIAMGDVYGKHNDSAWKEP